MFETLNETLDRLYINNDITLQELRIADMVKNQQDYKIIYDLYCDTKTYFNEFSELVVADSDIFLNNLLISYKYCVDNSKKITKTNILKQIKLL